MTRPERKSRSRAGFFSSRTATAGRPSPLLYSRLNDADVAHGAVAEHAQCFLVTRTVVAGDGLFQAGEFRHHEPFLQPGLVGHVRAAAAEVTHAERRKRDRGKL